MASRKAALAATQLAPHSWDFQNWPPQVWPHTPTRARYVARVFRTELLNAGALARIGKELVFTGLEYTAWLQTRRAKAAGSHLRELANRLRPKAAA
jgi:hypothetical protein